MSTRISKSAAYFLTFLVPISGLYISARDFREPYAKNIFWLFCCFMGLIFIYNPEGGSASDGSRYAEKLVTMSEASSFQEIAATFYSDEDNVTDIYQPIMTFIVSRFTVNPHILFFAFALVFGFFYSRCIWLFYEKYNQQRVTWSVFFVFLILGLICPIWNINGVRMWTALYVFLYGLLNSLLNENKRGLWFCGASFFVHFSFLAPCVLMAIYYLFPKKQITIDVLFVGFLLSLFVSQLNLSAVNSFLSSFEMSFAQSRINSYTNEDYAERISNKTSAISSYVGLFIEFRKWGIAAMLTVCWWFTRKFRNELSQSYLNYFSVVLFFSIFANIAANVPSGGRFQSLSAIMSVGAVLLFYKTFFENHRFVRFFSLFALFMIPPIFLHMRLGMYYHGISIFTQNFISAFFWEDVTPLMR